MYVFLSLISTAICVYIIWFVEKQRRIRRILSKFPTPPMKFFYGNAEDFISKEGMLRAFNDYTKKYGDIVYTRIGPLYHGLLFTDADLAKEVFQANINLTKGSAYEFCRSWLGHGLLTTDEKRWKKQRKIVTPAFNTQLLIEFIPVFDKQSNILIEKLDNAPSKDSLNIHRFIGLCSLDITCETSMGVKLGAQNEQNTEYVIAVKEMCRIIATRSYSMLKAMKLTYPFTEDYSIEKKSVKILHGFTDRVVQKKREQRKEQTESNLDQDGRSRRSNLLDILLDYSDKEKLLSEKEIRDEIHTFMFAGHDTVTAAMSFFVYEIAKNKDLQDLLYQEQQNVFGSNMDRDLDQSAINDLKLLDSVIKETMRLYPPVPVYTRLVTKEFVFDGKLIPEGITIIHFAYGTHRNPKYYDNPDTFDPYRFEDPKNLTIGSYLPFSTGPRNCIGQKFANNEMKVILSKLIRTFEFRPAEPEHELDLRAEVVLTSKNGINVKIIRRQQ
ncbi:cytochrome P450 4d8-like [Harmonia axyridis]|uniref:cytochrome P450 4d8-like n=1 Tax=Harmonia axyridis TaxID=115357 RepID=UPI001E276DE6|nr:cytochrome P450 4d8-like [Harmonia axyridis]